MLGIPTSSRRLGAYWFRIGSYYSYVTLVISHRCALVSYGYVLVSHSRFVCLRFRVDVLLASSGVASLRSYIMVLGPSNFNIGYCLFPIVFLGGYCFHHVAWIMLLPFRTLSNHDLRDRLLRWHQTLRRASENPGGWWELWCVIGRRLGRPRSTFLQIVDSCGIRRVRTCANIGSGCWKPDPGDRQTWIMSSQDIQIHIQVPWHSSGSTRNESMVLQIRSRNTSVSASLLGAIASYIVVYSFLGLLQGHGSSVVDFKPRVLGRIEVARSAARRF